MSKSWIYNISMYIHTAKNYCTVERNVTTDTYKTNWSQKQKSQVKESIYCVIPVTWWHGSRTGGSDWWWRKSDQRLPRAREVWNVDQTPENRGTPLGWSWRLWRSQMEVIFAKICQILHVKWVSFIAWNYTSLLCPWDSPGRNTGVGCHFLLQGIFLTQGLKLHLSCLLQMGSLPLGHQGSPSKVNPLPPQGNVQQWFAPGVKTAGGTTGPTLPFFSLVVQMCSFTQMPEVSLKTGAVLFWIFQVIKWDEAQRSLERERPGISGRALRSHLHLSPVRAEGRWCGRHLGLTPGVHVVQRETQVRSEGLLPDDEARGKGVRK